MNKKLRMKLVMAFAVAVCCLAIVGLWYILFYEEYVPVQAGYVVTAPSPVASPQISHRWESKIDLPDTHSRSDSYLITPTLFPTHGPSMAMWKTSSAGVTVISGGGNAGIYAGSSSASSSSHRGIRYGSVSGTMPMTTFLAMASVREVSAPGAAQAPQMASIAPRRAPGPPNTGGSADPDHQLVVQPVGDAAWPLACMAIAYALARILKRRRRA